MRNLVCAATGLAAVATSTDELFSRLHDAGVTVRWVRLETPWTAIRTRTTLRLADWLRPVAEQSDLSRQVLRVVLSVQLASLDLDLPGWACQWPFRGRGSQTARRIILRAGWHLWQDRPVYGCRIWFPERLAGYGDVPVRAADGWLMLWRAAQAAYEAGIGPRLVRGQRIAYG